MPLPRSTTTADTALASATADDGDSAAKPAAADDDPGSDLPDLTSSGDDDPRAAAMRFGFDLDTSGEDFNSRSIVFFFFFFRLY